MTQARNHVTNDADNKVVLITGASSGIGAAATVMLAARGARVAVAARRKDRLGSLVETITASGGQDRAYALDATDCNQVQSVVAAVAEDHGHIDVLINNAGSWPDREFGPPFERTTHHRGLLE